ncbi:hypothetical protein RRG08_040085 [Elysia crispata]|uniref:Uncharacterized protein n=1 Tax=Elysia crispata TaxID=231223 RepID=A0AAE1CN09_9GAST|nr:hypothetical protein RRG08_040085 [Elysia crispata]
MQIVLKRKVMTPTLITFNEAEFFHTCERICCRSVPKDWSGLTKMDEQALATDNGPIKKQVFEILSALCVYSREGYDRALEVLDHFKTIQAGLDMVYQLPPSCTSAAGWASSVTRFC